jgi:hypothetical protein
VPDETARVDVSILLDPRAANWPKADYIVGNPPFIGGKDVRARLGDGYFEALFRTTDVPESADFVMHWWERAAWAARKGGTRRFGFVTTNSITQLFSRRVIAKHLEAKDGIGLRFAIPNHPWIDEKNGASVRIAMTVAAAGRVDGQLLNVADEKGAPDRIEFRTITGMIGSDLRVGADVTKTISLLANAKLCSPGVKLHGDGFIVTREKAVEISNKLLINNDSVAIISRTAGQPDSRTAGQPDSRTAGQPDSRTAGFGSVSRPSRPSSSPTAMAATSPRVHAAR